MSRSRVSRFAASAAGGFFAALAVAALAPPPAWAGCGGTQIRHATRHVVPGRPPLIIGDSVLLGAMPQVQRDGFDLDTRGCRGWDEGMGVLRAYARAHRLPHLVVIELGADFSISLRQIRTAMRIAGPSRVLALMTPRKAPTGAGGSDAAHVREAGRLWPRRIKVLDWVRYSRPHPGWFQPDELHLTFAGADGFAGFLRRALRWASATPPPRQPRPAGGA